MNNPTPHRTLWTLAGLALAAGALLSCMAPFHWQAMRQKIHRKAVELRQLEGLQQVAARRQQAVDTYAALPSAVPAALPALTKSILPAATAEIHDLAGPDTVNGWSAHRSSVTYRDISYADVSLLLGGLETGRPPWRVVGLEIRAGRQSERATSIGLTVEALARSPEL